MVASAQGRDVSAFNAPLTKAALDGLSFAFTKATDGPSLTDPDFAANWATMGAAAGLHRGAYHELWGTGGSPAWQASHFTTVVARQGLRPGDMLAVVASDYSGVTDTDVLEFCDAVSSTVGPEHPVLVYTDLAVAKTLVTTSEKYGLWVAWPNPAAPGPADWAPARWPSWRFWQWGVNGTDLDAYNGTAAELDAWISTYTPGGHVATNPLHDEVWEYGAVWLDWATSGSPPTHMTGSPGAPMPDWVHQRLLNIHRNLVKIAADAVAAAVPAIAEAVVKALPVGGSGLTAAEMQAAVEAGVGAEFAKAFPPTA